MGLQDNVALVTGAGHGIGRTLAIALARDGAKVAVNYPFEEHEATEVVGEIASFGGEAIAVRADISDTAARDAMFDRTLRQFGRLDILVNNAAFDPGDTDFFRVDEELYDHVLGVNLKAMFFCCQSAAKAMLARAEGGRIVNISSIQSHQNLPRFAPYSISKGGVNALTRQLAVELAPHGITVNAIAPGFIEVERTMASFEDYSREEVARNIPVGRVGFPSDIGSLLCYLASEEASFITGAVINCDGGSMAKLSFQP
jgi:NAD(P)-dependent dehydrogenase (short-subunit alcohol dehydrogenase family)